MSPDLVFIVTYACPRCRASLEARAAVGPPTWLRCPKCGRASLPPEHVRAPSPRMHPVDDDVFLIGPEERTNPGPSAPGLPIRPRSMAPKPIGGHPTPKTPTTRLILGTGLFLTTFLFLFSLLEQNGTKSAAFGMVAVFFLFLLSRPTPPAPRDAIRYP